MSNSRLPAGHVTAGGVAMITRGRPDPLPPGKGGFVQDTLIPDLIKTVLALAAFCAALAILKQMGVVW